jgi:hypothetical protein
MFWTIVAALLFVFVALPLIVIAACAVLNLALRLFGRVGFVLALLAGGFFALVAMGF